MNPISFRLRVRGAHAETGRSPLSRKRKGIRAPWLWIFAFALLITGCQSGPSRVVLYSAQDQEFADKILEDFTAHSGLPVKASYDSEANMTVGLFSNLVKEKGRPRCDVHWNNEIINTIRLAKLGILEPYDSPSAKDYPDSCRDKEHRWTAFAARVRIMLINTDRLQKLGIAEKDWPRSLEDLLHPRWKGHIAMAKPMAGTTATEAVCLHQVWGKDKAAAFYRGLLANGVHVVPGNKQSAEAVGAGTVAVGLTDTDDAMGEVEAGRPVRVIFPDADAPEGSKRGTLFLPNTVALIHGCPNPEGGRKLIDYVLSAPVEKQLAESASRQLPLNPKVKATLPPALAGAGKARHLPVDFEAAAEQWDEVQAFLREVYGRP